MPKETTFFPKSANSKSSVNDSTTLKVKQPPPPVVIKTTYKKKPEVTIKNNNTPLKSVGNIKPEISPRKMEPRKGDSFFQLTSKK